MDSEMLTKLQKQLHSTMPLIGGMQQRAAVKKLAAASGAQAVPLLVEALECSDAQAAAAADAALRALSAKDAVDCLCKLAIDDPSSKAAQICLATQKRPRDHEVLCLFLFVTRQLDDYFKEDFEFQDLHLAYERAEQKIKNLVMEVVRSGDKRCLGFFGSGGRKPLSQCTEMEIKLALESALRHSDWPRLFRAAQELPLKYGYPLLEPLRKSGWEPADPEQKSLFKQMLAESSGKVLPAPQTDKPTSSVFDKWLADGKKLQNLSKQELLQKLDAVTPPEKVSVVAALAVKAPDDPAVIDKVEKSGHWLVRLAGLATGLTGKDIVSEVKDDNYWINALHSAAGVLEFWPGKATPADREKLAAAPPEAYSGKLGAVRRVLRLLVNYRVTVGSFEEMSYEAGEFAGTFEEVK